MLIELVMIVSRWNLWRLRAISSVVVPESSRIVSFSSISVAATRPIACFSRVLKNRLLWIGVSSLLSASVLGRPIAPPRVRISRFRSSSALRSLRIVTSDTPNSRWSSSTEIADWLFSRCRIIDLLPFVVFSVLSIVLPGVRLG